MRDVYIDTLADLKTLYPSLHPYTEPSTTTEYGKNTYTLFNSIEDNLTTGWRAWRIAQATVAVVVGIFPGFLILLVIPRYRHWIAENWNEGYSGIEKISIYVLPIVLEEFNNKEESETEEFEQEITLEVPTDSQLDRQDPTKSKHTDSPMKSPNVGLDYPTSRSQRTLNKAEPKTEELKAEITLADETKPQSGRQAPTQINRTGTPMKGPYVGLDYPTSRSQRTLLNSNITKMPTRSETKNNQAPVVESRETLTERFANLAFKPPQGCTKDVQDKIMEIYTDMLNKQSFNVDAANQILALDLLALSALEELEEYSLAL